jgi:hypothetical protein
LYNTVRRGTTTHTGYGSATPDTDLTQGIHKGKGKVPRWGLSALQPSAYCTLTPKEFLLSSLEALHTKRRERPQIAKEGTIDGI